MFSDSNTCIQLRSECRKRNIKGFSKLNKQGLIKLLNSCIDDELSPIPIESVPQLSPQPKPLRMLHYPYYTPYTFIDKDSITKEEYVKGYNLEDYPDMIVDVHYRREHTKRGTKGYRIPCSYKMIKTNSVQGLRVIKYLRKREYFNGIKYDISKLDKYFSPLNTYYYLMCI